MRQRSIHGHDEIHVGDDRGGILEVRDIAAQIPDLRIAFTEKTLVLLSELWLDQEDIRERLQRGELLQRDGT